MSFTLLLNSEARAAEPRPDYKFNVLGDPDFSEEKTNLKLKVSNNKQLSKVDPVKALRNSQPYTGYVIYPRYQFEATLAPMKSGFRQDYYDLPMNFSITSYDSVVLGGRYLFTPHLFAEMEYSHSSFSVQGQNSGSYQVLESTANIETIVGRFTYCSVGNHAMNKLCYAAVLGWDAYPSLEFVSSAQLRISSVNDMALGARIGYDHIIAPFITFTSAIEYLHGLGQGQNSALGVDSDKRIRADLGFSKQNSKNLDFYSLGVAYSYREATIHGSTGSYMDYWSTQTSTITLLMKYTWTWNKGG
jgi:hypothetical protein